MKPATRLAATTSPSRPMPRSCPWQRSLPVETPSGRAPGRAPRPAVRTRRASAPAGRSRRLVAMNRFHRRYCGSAGWARLVEHELLPWALDGVALGDDVLEIGPGLGVTTRLLARQVQRLTVLEVDERFVARLGREFGGPDGPVAGVAGDGAAMPFPDGRFSAAVCFTMLHHVPSPALQDRLFAEA